MHKKFNREPRNMLLAFPTQNWKWKCRVVGSDDYQSAGSKIEKGRIWGG